MAEQVPEVAVVMGSASDATVMSQAVELLAEFDLDAEVRVLSAHRLPHEMLAWGAAARARGTKVIIAGAGGAAHLPGMLAAATTLPVIGVPVSATKLAGVDALLSIVQMPKGVPVATVAVDGARNAGLLAVEILSLASPQLADALDEHKRRLRDDALGQDDQLRG